MFLPKRFLLLSLSVLGLTGYTQAQKILEGPQAEEVLSGSQLIRYVEGRSAPDFIALRTQSRFDADNVMPWLQKVLGMKNTDQLVWSRSESDELGMSHSFYQQVYQGVPVEHGYYRVHTLNGEVVSVNGAFYSLGNINVNASVSAESAIQFAKTFIGASVYKWELEGEEEFIKWESGDPNATFAPQPQLVIISKNANYAVQDFRLAWKMDVYAHAPMSRHSVYVDAHTGEVIFSEDKICHADAIGSATTGYSGVRQITADSFNGSFRLRESGRGNGIRTYDMNNGTSYGNSVDFTDSDNNWVNPNPSIDQYALDAHWGSEMTYDYFLNTHNRNSINGSGYNLLSYVHYDNGYDNAFWDGTRMTYGDGGSYFTSPLTTIDIAGHEITHGLTSNTANLIYQNESGALNESFSDIFGVCIDNFGRGTTGTNLWRMGEECTGGSGIRRMDNPGAFGDPDTYNAGNWYTGTGDNGGVHTNSGVQNYWFYLLCQGGSGTNDIGNAFNVTGIGMLDASKIAFRNLTVYLGQNSNYSDARFYAIQSAIDLFGGCTPQVQATTNAWYAVGVGPVYTATVTAGFSSPTTQFCSVPATAFFNNSSSNASSFTWYFGDGGTSTASNPSHTYNSFGTYTVKLVANGGNCGNDSVIQTNYIVVDQNLPCIVTLNQNGNNSLQTGCNGTLYDTGGPNGNYQDNVNSTITIAPVGASQITLTFTSFDFEAGYDYLYIYDGPSIGSPLIGQYDGTALPNGGTITSTGGAITIRQYTDPGVVESGFAMNWNCLLPNSPPNANFSTATTVTCDGLVSFTDQTTNGASSWMWYFGDGNTSTLQSPTHTYVNDGVYTVSLVASNLVGSDSIAFVNMITVDRPNAPVAADQYFCTSPVTTSITATASNDINWYTSLNGTTPFFTGTTYNTPSLSNATTYYLENQVPQPSQYVGPVNNSFGGGGQHNNNSVQYLTFTVSQNATLVSAWVNAGSAGNRTINLWDGNGSLVDSRYINISAGQGRVPLNFNLAPGTYRLGGQDMNLYRNNSGPSYPYTLPGILSITGSSAGAAFYYYFYDWEVQLKPCVSPRVPVTLNIGNLAANFTQVVNGLTVNFTNTSSGANSYNWNFGDGNTSTQQNPTHTYSAAGTYNVVLIVDNGSCSDTVTYSIDVTNVGVENNPITVFETFPNPFTESVSIQLDMSSGGKLQILAYNTLGEVMAVIYSGYAGTGLFATQWSGLSNLPAGVYFIKATANDSERIEKIVKF